MYIFYADFDSNFTKYLLSFFNAINETYNHNAIWLDSGDIFEGGYESSLTNGDIMFKGMENRVSATTLGNHQFNYGEEELRKKIESGKLDLVPVQYDLGALINDVLTLIKMRTASKGLAFFVRIDPALPHKLIGDENRVKQVLINILGNAVKYTKEGFIRLDVSGMQQGKTLRLTFRIQDSGVGIKDEDFSKLFELFSRVDTKRNRNVVGTGLGLSITKQLCEMMNGSISVKSEYEKGSTFTAVVHQTVSNYKPLVDIKDAENKKILYFEPNNRTNQHVMEEFKALNANVDLCVDTVPI